MSTTPTPASWSERTLSLGLWTDSGDSSTKVSLSIVRKFNRGIEHAMVYRFTVLWRRFYVVLQKIAMIKTQNKPDHVVLGAGCTGCGLAVGDGSLRNWFAMIKLRRLCNAKSEARARSRVFCSSQYWLNEWSFQIVEITSRPRVVWWGDLRIGYS